MNQDISQVERTLRSHPALLQRIMHSQDGQTLLRLLNQNGFDRAVEAAARGDSGEIARRIQQLAQTTDGAALLDRLAKTLGM